MATAIVNAKGKKRLLVLHVDPYYIGKYESAPSILLHFEILHYLVTSQESFSKQKAKYWLLYVEF